MQLLVYDMLVNVRGIMYMYGNEHVELAQLGTAL